MESLNQFIRKNKKIRSLSLSTDKGMIKIKGFSIPSCTVTINHPTIFWIYFHGEKPMKCLSLITFLRTKCTFDNADIYPKKNKMAVYATSLELPNQLERELWIARSMEEVELALNEFLQKTGKNDFK